jgi:hypothetical protein
MFAKGLLPVSQKRRHVGYIPKQSLAIYDRRNAITPAASPAVVTQPAHAPSVLVAYHFNIIVGPMRVAHFTKLPPEIEGSIPNIL